MVIMMKMKNNYLKFSQKGLTLVELLISMAVMALIIGGLVAAFVSHNRVSAEEEARMEVQQNLRVAVDRLSHVLRHAGFGSYDSFENNKSMSGDDPEGNGVLINNFISKIDNQGSEGSEIEDSFIFTYGFKKVGEVDYESSNPDDYEIELKNLDGPTITSGSEFKRYLSFYPSSIGNRFFEVESANDDGDSLTFVEDDIFTSVDFEREPDVYMVNPARIKVTQDDDHVLYIQDFAYDISQHWIIAENIVALRLQYHVNGEWKDEPTSDELQHIRKIRFTMWGEKEINDEVVSMESQGEVVLRNAF